MKILEISFLCIFTKTSLYKKKHAADDYDMMKFVLETAI